MNRAQLPTSETSPIGRVSYAHVFKPTLNKLSGKMEYSYQHLFEHGADLAKMKTAILNACINKWGPDKAKWPAKINSPFKSQKVEIDRCAKKGQEHAHLHPEAFFVTFKSPDKDGKGNTKPAPIVVDKNPKIVITEESKFYSGCWAKCNFNAFAYDKGGNAGVTLYINALQFCRDGDRFGGRPSPETAFEAIPEDDVAPGGAADATSMFS
jgi:hypothetical protein